MGENRVICPECGRDITDIDRVVHARLHWGVTPDYILDNDEAVRRRNIVLGRE